MQVTIDARYLGPERSGIGGYTEHLVRELLAHDDELTLCLVLRRQMDLELPANRVRYKYWDAAPNGLRTLRGASLGDDLGDLWHSPFNVLAGGVDVPAVFTLHDIMWLIDPSYCTNSAWRRAVTGNFYRAAIPASVKRAAAIMTVSEHSKNDIEDRFPAARGRVFVTYNGVDASFRPMAPDEGWEPLRSWLEPGTPFVLAVGQGSPYKNHGRAVEAFARAFADEPDVKFVLVRRFERGPDPILDAALARPEVARRVIRLSSVSQPEIYSLYTKARMLAFPSLYEGFGLPALEAMASGTPVLSSDRGAPAEVAGDAALQADPEDVAALAEAMRRLHFEDDERQVRIERGLARAAEFTWARTARQAHAVYRRVLEEAT